MKEILDFLKSCWKRQHYEYRFELKNGLEENKQIKIANSIEYEFINSGNTIVIINNLQLFPQHFFRAPNSIKLRINKNEQDVTVYNYDFKVPAPGDFVFGSLLYSTGWITKGDLVNSGFATSITPINLLQVIIKQPSTQ